MILALAPFSQRRARDSSPPSTKRITVASSERSPRLPSEDSVGLVRILDFRTEVEASKW